MSARPSPVPAPERAAALARRRERVVSGERRRLRHRAELALFRAAAVTLASLPEPAAHRAGRAAARLAFGLLSSRRRILLTNLAAAFPGKPASEIAAIARGSVEGFATSLVDFLRGERLTREQLLSRVSVEGEEHLRAARARGRGVFLLSAHFGGWEIGALVAGLLGEPIAPVVRPLDNPLLEEELLRRRSRFGNRPIAKKQAARELLRAMRRQETVAILLDQNTRRHEAVFVPFFGRMAGTNPSLARLALRTDAAVVPVFTWPEGNGRYRLRFERPILASEFRDSAAVEERVVRATASYMAVTEDAIRRAPAAWLWVHDRWKTGPRGRLDVPRSERTVSRLVVAPTWIGDSVLALPLLRALRQAYPADRLVVLARPGPAAIFRAEGSADEVRVVSGILRDSFVLARERFREAWLLPNSFRSAVVPLLARIPERIGYSTDSRGPLLTSALPTPARTVHQLRDYDALLASRGIEPDELPPRLEVPHDAATRVERILEAAGVESEDGLVLLAPGAAFGWTKRWPPERFGRLASALRARGLAPAIVIGPGEEDIGRAVSEASGLRLPVLGADLDPIGVAALAARARLVVSNDSGPMHLAAAVGTPVVAMFGPTDPGRTGPVGSPSVVLDRYVFCSPCYLTECPYGHECMREVEVETVMRAVERLLTA